MPRHGNQYTLFDTPRALPNGFIYRPHFITPEEEWRLIAHIENLPLEHSTFREFTAKRRAVGFGWGYDFRHDRLVPGPPLPSFLKSLQNKIGKWLDISPRQVVEALVTEYPPNTQIGWHRDREKFEKIIGISLSGWCHMRLRPLSRIKDPKAVIKMELEPRSAYVMQGESRWRWQHSIAPTKTLRYSITFRTIK